PAGPALASRVPLTESLAESEGRLWSAEGLLPLCGGRSHASWGGEGVAGRVDVIFGRSCLPAIPPSGRIEQARPSPKAVASHSTPKDFGEAVGHHHGGTVLPAGR